MGHIRTQVSKTLQAVKPLLRSLRYKNYRLFFAGQMVSLIGTWMQTVALSWLIYRLGQSAFLLGVAGFCSQLPTVLLAPFSGVFIDRGNKKKILLITQALAMVQAFILAALTLSGHATIPHILALSVFLGVVNTFDMPTRHSFVSEMIEREEDLGNAIALNSIIFNSARLIGPAVGGLIIAAFGEGVCFLINALTYLPIIFNLSLMRIKRPKEPAAAASLFDDLRDGFRYTFGSAPIRTVLLLFSIVNLVGVSFTILLPVFAKEVLGGGVHVYGFLVGCAGVGALLGALFIASRTHYSQLQSVIPRAALVFGIGIVALSFCRQVWLALVIMVVTGFGMMVQITSSNTLVQSLSDFRKRGRVMSFYTMAFIGMVTVGTLLMGALASRIGISHALLVSGSLCVLSAGYFNERRFALRTQ